MTSARKAPEDVRKCYRLMQKYENMTTYCNNIMVGAFIDSNCITSATAIDQQNTAKV